MLRALLREGAPLRVWEDESCAASWLLDVEARRVIQNRRLSLELNDEEVAIALADLETLGKSLTWLPVSRPILRRAGQPFALAIRSLDAIHLASALAAQRRLGQDLRFATHDVRLGRAARALGFEVIGVDS